MKNTAAFVVTELEILMWEDLEDRDCREAVVATVGDCMLEFSHFCESTDLHNSLPCGHVCINC